MKNISAKEYLNQFITMQLEIKRKKMRLHDKAVAELEGLFKN